MGVLSPLASLGVAVLVGLALGSLVINLNGDFILYEKLRLKLLHSA